MSIRRATVSTVELVWSVESTRWPVRAASMAISPVSLSRISPSMIVSGSRRKMVRKAAAKVRPILALA
ncbi:hypothetical protein D3C72_2451620 [compost metagenome]